MEDDDNTTMITDSTSQLTDLIQSLEQATLMAKQLRSTTAAADNHRRRRILSALTSANLSLSAFLAQQESDNSAGASDGEPMVIADGGDAAAAEEVEEEEMMSKDSSMEKVEEKMREFLYIQNKRPKRRLSPGAAAAVERRFIEDRENVRVSVTEFDPIRDRLRNFDLVYQFHA